MTPLPPQTPARRRTVALRPRNDRYTLPTFRESAPRRDYSHPIETYDPRNEPRPFSWSELADPKLWLEGGLAVAIGVIGLIVILSSGPAPR